MNFLLFLYLIGHHNKVTSKTLFNLTTGVKIEEYPASCAEKKKTKAINESNFLSGKLKIILNKA